MDNSNIIDVNETDFEEKVINASDKKLIIVDFWAPWCGPCKQLTPIMEKIAKQNQDSFDLVKINIDDNQQIAAQLRIQSIPTVYAFKDKKVVNAFQGVISEKDFTDFIEKSSGEKLKEDNSNFYNNIKKLIDLNQLDEAKDKIMVFLSKNSNDPAAISLYLECLLAKKEFEELDDFVSSLNNEMKQNNEIIQVLKKIKIINKAKKF